MSQPSRRIATWEDLDSVPEGWVGEIVGGEVVLNPRPDPPHTEASSDLGGLLVGWFRFGFGGPGGWVILTEPRIRFGDEVRVPDLAGWKRGRFSRPERGPYEVVPDWACEILSTRTAKVDRGEKLPLYAGHGVLHCWLVDPLAQTLEVFRLEGDGWRLLAVHTGSANVRVEPFEAVELDLSLIWGPPPADEMQT